MSRVTIHPDYTNPIKSISFIPDHYVNISVKAQLTGVTEYKAGQVVKVDLAKLEIVQFGGDSQEANDGNAVVFVDQKVNEQEGTPVTVLIHGFVNAAKLVNAERLAPGSQITVLGAK